MARRVQRLYGGPPVAVRAHINTLLALLAPHRAQLLRTLAEQRITHLAAVPTLWRALAATLRQQGGGPAPPPPLCLRLAVSSGEALAPELLSELQQLLPAGCRILNLYGSTEVAADCTAFDCTTWRPPLIDGGQQPPGAARVPVGQPIGGTLVAVLAAPAADEADSSPSSGNSAAGEQRAVLPVGSVGEVALAGAGLAAGYLGAHPAAAAAQQQRFVELPTTQLQAALQAGGSVVAAADLPGDFWQQGSARCFLTGDLGWLDASGCLHLAGRRDHQVKISGAAGLGHRLPASAPALQAWPVLFWLPCRRSDPPAPCTLRLPAGVRIDLAEVEAALAQHPAVAAAAAKLWQLAAGPVLAGYVQLAAGLGQAAPSTADLRAWCEQRLPAAAVPRHLLTLPLLPRSPAGKVLCSQLPHPLNAAAAAADADQQQPSKRPRAGSLAAAAATAAPHAQQPGGVSELAVSRAFARALGHSDFEATSNLFAVGGNSLHAAQIAGEVAGGDVAAVIAHPTVRSLAAFLSARAAAVAAGGQPPGGQQQQEQQPAAVEARQLLAGGSSGSGGAADGPLQLAWRARMLQCVDAAPLLEPETAAAPAEQEQRAFACSHGGDICCYDARSGRQLWQAQMLGCTDAGLALCAGQQQQQLVAVGTNSGTLCFLDASSGSEVGSLDCGGGIRAPPAVDPWRGLVWQPTHGRQLLVAAAPGREVARLPLPAAASAAVVFAAEQRLAFVCCLDGSVLAIATPDAGSSSSSGGGTGLQLQVAWQRQHGAPLFAPAVPLPRPAVAVASVDGSVSALGADDGTQLWRASVGSAVFAPLLALALEPAAAQQQQRRRHVLLAGTQAGRVAALDAATGERLAAVELGAKVTGLAVAAAAAGEDAAGPRQQQLLVVTLAPGIMVLLDAARLLEGGGRAAVLDAVRLPGDTFAPPAAASSGAGGVRVAVGCRDDHLYCLELPGPL